MLSEGVELTLVKCNACEAKIEKKELKRIKFKRHTLDAAALGSFSCLREAG